MCNIYPPHTYGLQYLSLMFRKDNLVTNLSSMTKSTIGKTEEAGRGERKEGGGGEREIILITF